MNAYNVNFPRGALVLIYKILFHRSKCALKVAQITCTVTRSLKNVKGIRRFNGVGFLEREGIKIFHRDFVQTNQSAISESTRLSQHFSRVQTSQLSTLRFVEGRSSKLVLRKSETFFKLREKARINTEYNLCFFYVNCFVGIST
jgi:hypothetical protein